MKEPRFFVLSMVFMYNTKCTFNKQGQIEFGEKKWQIPIQAITQIKYSETDKKIELKLTMDTNQMNLILK